MPIIEDTPHEEFVDLLPYDEDLQIDVDSGQTDFEYYICMVANAKELSLGAKNTKIAGAWPLMEKVAGHRLDSIEMLGIVVKRPSNASDIIPGTNIIRDS